MAVAMGVKAGVSAESPDWYVFTIPGLDASPSALDLSWMNDKPAGADGFIRAQDGHFVDQRGKRIRFFGTNVTATGAFPEKAVAPAAAKHLRKLGFNVVRFHFMDTGAAPVGLFKKDLVSFDPEQVDKLDYFISQLKKNGIYVNLNMHVARRYPGLDREVAKRYWYGKLIDRFYPPFVQMQHQYARALLTHKNPYTGHRYADEPAVLCIELNNENTLLPFWGGRPDDVPDPYRSELVRQWRVWLKERYKSTKQLREAWSRGVRSAGDEVLRNRNFTKGKADWTAQAAGGAEAALELLTLGTGEGIPPALVGQRALRWHASKPGTANWHLQLHQSGLTLENGRSYEVAFWAKSTPTMNLELTTMLDQPPWNNVGLVKNANLTAVWKQYSFFFKASDTVPSHNRLNFSTHNRTGVIELASVSLREAAVVGLPEDQSFKADNIALVGANAAPTAYRDYWRFLMETEQATTRGLIRLLKEELKVKSLVIDTQASYGGVAGLFREATLSDFIDMHGYWEHPHFEETWSPTKWSIGNSTQVAAKDGGTLGDIARHRVAGKPFTVSEYNTPAPNDHAAEALPMLAAIGAFQDWDAIYQYTYLNFSDEWESDRILGFFSLCGHAGQLAFAPFSALLFRQGLALPGIEPVSLRLPAEGVVELMAQGRSGLDGLWSEAGVAPGAVSMRRLEVTLTRDRDMPVASAKVKARNRRVSDTGELVWKFEKRGACFMLRPACRMAVGALVGAPQKLGDVTLEVTKKGENYACAGLVALDMKPIAESRKVLFVLVARYENQGMGWDNGRHTVRDRWGNGPGVAELVHATLTLPGHDWKAQSLDGSGAAMADLETVSMLRDTQVRFGDRAPSLWYLLSR